VSGSVTIRLKELGLISCCDEARDMVDDVLALGGSIESSDILEISWHHSHSQACERCGFRGRAGQRRHFVTPP
jgi:hypothetical protein